MTWPQLNPADEIVVPAGRFENGHLPFLNFTNPPHGLERARTLERTPALQDKGFARDACIPNFRSLCSLQIG